MPSARTVALSVALLLPQVFQVSAVKWEVFSAAGCKSADFGGTGYMAEGECHADEKDDNMFWHYTCNSSWIVGKRYADKACTTPHASKGNTWANGVCEEGSSYWLKVTCGVGSVKIPREFFSDSGCTTSTGSSPMYMDAGCSLAGGNRSRKVVVSASTLTMDEYDSTDCSGAVSKPSNATCMACVKTEYGKYQKLGVDTCVGGTSAVAGSGVRASPPALFAIAAVALLAQ